jgi:hypothetical protein
MPERCCENAVAAAILQQVVELQGKINERPESVNCTVESGSLCGSGQKGLSNVIRVFEHLKHVTDIAISYLPAINQPKKIIHLMIVVY